MPRLACEGNGHDVLCNPGTNAGEPDIEQAYVTNLDGTPISTAKRGETVRLIGFLHNDDVIMCANFLLKYFVNNVEVGCYEDRLSAGSDWAVPLEYTIPDTAPLYQPLTIKIEEWGFGSSVRTTAQTILVVEPKDCADCTNPEECFQNLCYWYNNSCHSSQPTCGELNNQVDCETYGCYWCNGQCQDNPCGGCTSPTGEEEEEICGYPEYGQDPTHIYKCTGGIWVDQGYDASCAAGCVEGTIEILEYCPDGTTVKRERKCENGVWVYYTYTCPGNGNGDECEIHTTQSACEAAGCFWYPYPNPLDEPSCHSKEWYMSYLPFMIAGAGGLLLLVALMSPSRAPRYYPQPHYYPPR